MPERTENEKFLIKYPTKSAWINSTHTHIWFQVLEGKDQGIRVRINLFDKRVSDEIRSRVQSLEQDDVVEAVLQRENDSWYPLELEQVGSV